MLPSIPDSVPTLRVGSASRKAPRQIPQVPRRTQSFSGGFLGEAHLAPRHFPPPLLTAGGSNMRVPSTGSLNIPRKLVRDTHSPSRQPHWLRDSSEATSWLKTPSRGLWRHSRLASDKPHLAVYQTHPGAFTSASAQDPPKVLDSINAAAAVILSIKKKKLQGTQRIFRAVKLRCVILNGGYMSSYI